MFDILHVLCNGLITLLRTDKILVIRPWEEEAYVLSRVVHVARDVVEVERSCTSEGKMDIIIALRSN